MQGQVQVVTRSQQLFEGAPTQNHLKLISNFITACNWRTDIFSFLLTEQFFFLEDFKTENILIIILAFLYIIFRFTWWENMIN